MTLELYKKNNQDNGGVIYRSIWTILLKFDRRRAHDVDDNVLHVGHHQNLFKFLNEPLLNPVGNVSEA